MKKPTMTALMIAIGFAGMAHGFEEEPNIFNSVEYELLLPGQSVPLGGWINVENEDIMTWAGDADQFYFAARASSATTGGGGVTGSGSSCTMRDSAEVLYLNVSSFTSSKKRMYLSDNNFTIDYHWDGDLELFNPHEFVGGEFEIDFGEEGEGMIEVGYRVNISAESSPGHFWQTMPEYGAWQMGIASEDDSIIFDSSTGASSTSIPINVSDSATYGYWVNNDIGKPFDLTVSLETWVEGYGFDVTEVQDGLFGMSSNFIDTLSAEIVSGASETPVPEPGTSCMLLCLAISFLVAIRRR